MPIDPESLYRQLGQLVADTPADLAGSGPISADTHRWLGRAAALIEAQPKDAGATVDWAGFTVCSDGLTSHLRQGHVHRIMAILHRALARAELNAPAGVRGAFVAVGAEFDALQAIGKVLREATKDVLFVDAYMDATVLTDFAVLAPEGVLIRLLTDGFYTKSATMQPPTERWTTQYGAKRRLEVKLTAPRLLHDRLIIVDTGARVWSLTQSLKDFAARSPASVLRVEGDLARLKVEAYEQMWVNAQPL
jgi:hypothetical protein